MPNPVPGTNYTVVKGDNLWDLSTKAYGDPWLWESIFEANQIELTPNTPNKWGYIMHAGDVIFIPGDRLKDSFKNSFEFQTQAKADDTMTFLINGHDIPITNGRIIRTIDTPADAFTGSTAFFPLNQAHQELFFPYQYQEAIAGLGNQRQVTGALYKPVTSTQPEGGSTVEIHAFTSTVDALDSTVKAPYERRDITLQERIRELVEPRGITVIWEYEGEDKPFKKVKTSKSEKIGSHILKLAKQRGVVLSSTKQGALLCTSPALEGTVGTLEEGKGILRSEGLAFDGRKRFASYAAFGTGPAKNIKAVSKDASIARSRMMAFEANDTEEDDIQGAADYKRNMALADALSTVLPVSSWKAPNGEYWEENSLITVVSPSIFLPNGFTFLIREVEFLFGMEGSPANITIVPPTVYTKEELVNPWARG